MKSTKNSSATTKSSSTGKNSKGKAQKSSSGSKKNCKNASEQSDSDPYGSYTGNPQGWGKYAKPVQDVDDL